MVDDRWPPSAQSQSHWGWLRVLLLGIVLFVITTIVMFVTGNPKLWRQSLHRNTTTPAPGSLG